MSRRYKKFNDDSKFRAIGTDITEGELTNPYMILRKKTRGDTLHKIDNGIIQVHFDCVAHFVNRLLNTVAQKV